MTINLHINRLVLDGINIAPDERHLLQANLTIELSQLLNNGGLADSLVKGAALPHISTNSIQLNDNKPMELGQQIAQSLYGGIGHE